MSGIYLKQVNIFLKVMCLAADLMATDTTAHLLVESMSGRVRAVLGEKAGPHNIKHVVIMLSHS